jgi:RNA polymerase sigma-70 factor (ECF subfamily)
VRKVVETVEDGKIVDLYLSRDESAIRETSEKYGPRLRSFSMSIVDDLQTAEECENDTYMEAWNSIPPHEPKDYLYAFLAHITRHLSLNCCRKRSCLKRSALVSLTLKWSSVFRPLTTQKAVLIIWFYEMHSTAF